MKGLNKVSLMGNVGKDSELKQTNVSQVVSFSIAIDESYKNKKGEKVEKTEWVNVSAWNKQAEILAKYVKQGDLIYVEGKLQTRKHEDKYYTSVLISDFRLMPNNRQQTEQTQQPVSHPPMGDNVPSTNQAPDTQEDEDLLPF